MPPAEQVRVCPNDPLQTQGVHRPPGTERGQAVGLPSFCVRPEGLEPPTPGSEDRYSIQLSYGRLRAPSERVGVRFADSCLAMDSHRMSPQRPRVSTSPSLGGATGFEPATPRTTTWCANQLRHAPHMSLCTPGRIRTSGQRLRRPLLCPLSYGRRRAPSERVGVWALPKLPAILIRTRPSNLDGLLNALEFAPRTPRLTTEPRTPFAPCSAAESYRFCGGQFKRLERKTGIEPA